MSKIKVLFVCMGNICRSPTAEGVFSQLVESKGLSHRFEIDSAGTHAYHVGNSPDQRAQQTARQRGIDLSNLRARQVNDEDFEEFDYLLAMDNDNYENLKADCPKEYHEKVIRFLDYAPQQNRRDVPDPYYGGKSGFDDVFDLVEMASQGFLDSVISSK